jgi:hypothetical protein
MKYKIELITQILTNASSVNIVLHSLKKCVDDYANGGRGVIVGHDSLSDYIYDTTANKYNQVDTRGVIGHVVESVIENGRFYIIADINDDIVLSDKLICFYRSNIKDNQYINFFAIDLITIEDKDEIPVEHLSHFEKYINE